MDSNELVRVLKDKVTRYSVSSNPVADQVTMGGKILSVYQPLNIKMEDGTKIENELTEMMKDHMQFHTAVVDDGLGKFYVDLHISAYEYFKSIFTVGNLILATGLPFTFVKKVNDKEIEQEFHVRAFNIEKLYYDQEEPAIV
jgi:hypothetical protein